MNKDPRPLTAISVPFDQLDTPQLSYPRLRPAVEQYFWDDYEAADELFERFEAGDAGGFEWRRKHLLVAALKLQTAAADAERRLWSRRYTAVSIELYGRPDPGRALELAAADRVVFSEVYDSLPAETREVVQPAIDAYHHIVPENGPAVPGQSISRYKLLRDIRQYLFGRFGDVFDVLASYKDDDLLDNRTVCRLYNQMIARLAVGNKAWRGWQAVPVETTQMQVMAARRQVLVGSYMPPLPVRRVRGLFAHEVLVHAQRAVRGARYDRNLTYGLPGYTTAEEGLGILMEAAVEGKMPYRVGDRYIDLSLALGQLSLPALSRPQLFDIVLARARLRWAAESAAISEKSLRRVVWQHVNRLYRGTLGNEFIGVNTKDSVYYRGYEQMASYVGRYKGDDFYRALDFVLSGKLNPSSPEHRLYIHKSRFNIAQEDQA